MTGEGWGERGGGGQRLTKFVIQSLESSISNLSKSKFCRKRIIFHESKKSPIQPFLLKVANSHQINHHEARVSS